MSLPSNDHVGCLFVAEYCRRDHGKDKDQKNKLKGKMKKRGDDEDGDDEVKFNGRTREELAEVCKAHLDI